MTDLAKQFVCRACKGQRFLAFCLADRPHAPTLLRCLSCGHEELI